jgi:hypothetical protein
MSLLVLPQRKDGRIILSVVEADPNGPVSSAFLLASHTFTTGITKAVSNT